MNRIDEKRIGEELLSQEPWLKEAAQELRRPLQPSVAGQLRAARRTALEQAKTKDKSRNFGFGNSFLPAGLALAAGVSAIGIAVVMLQSGSQTVEENQTMAQTESQPTPQAKQASGSVLLEDLAIMSGQEDLQFYQDLELLEWLEQQGSLDVQG